MRYFGFGAVLGGLALSVTGMQANEERILEPLRPYVREVVAALASVPTDRREVLDQAADFIVARRAAGQPARLTFLCTHNSRRSHLAQVWAQTAAWYFGLEGVATYSGGTEATACNARTVRALRRAGFSVVTRTPGENPVYLVQYAEAATPLPAWSKVYHEEGNPTEDFAAMMCCADADERCPVVFGADARIPLHYADPKAADGTPEEGERYDERCRQIAEEMFYVMARVAERTGR